MTRDTKGCSNVIWDDAQNHPPDQGRRVGCSTAATCISAQKNHPVRSGSLCRRRPIFPGSCPPSIFGAVELNYRVRDGNGWDLNAIDTDFGVRFFRKLSYNITQKTVCQALFSFFQIFFEKQISENGGLRENRKKYKRSSFHAAQPESV